MKKEGFTLVEMIAVVAIIAILSSIAYIKLIGAAENARIGRGLAFEAQIYRSLGHRILSEWLLEDNANDSTAYENHGTWVGTEDYDSDCISGQCAEFNGSSYINLDGFGDEKKGTISAWIYRTFDNSTAKYPTAFSLGKGEPNTSNNEFFYYKDDDKFRFHYNRITPPDLNYIDVDPSMIPKNKWVHIAWSWEIIDIADPEKNSLKAYIDGELVGSDTIQGGVMEPFANAKIGCESRLCDEDHWIGKIDRVRIYSEPI